MRQPKKKLPIKLKKRLDNELLLLIFIFVIMLTSFLLLSSIVITDKRNSNECLSEICEGYSQSIYHKGLCSCYNYTAEDLLKESYLNNKYPERIDYGKYLDYKLSKEKHVRMASYIDEFENVI